MNKIKFSHVYRKLHGIDLSKPAVLIRIEEINCIKQLPENFLVYDTAYNDDKGDRRYYPLKNNQKYLLLYFMDAHGVLFTTIRRWTPEKFKYYLTNQGCGFDIVNKLQMEVNK